MATAGFNSPQSDPERAAVSFDLISVEKLLHQGLRITAPSDYSAKRLSAFPNRELHFVKAFSNRLRRFVSRTGATMSASPSVVTSSVVFSSISSKSKMERSMTSAKLLPYLLSFFSISRHPILRGSSTSNYIRVITFVIPLWHGSLRSGNLMARDYLTSCPPSIELTSSPRSCSFVRPAVPRRGCNRSGRARPGSSLGRRGPSMPR